MADKYEEKIDAHNVFQPYQIVHVDVFFFFFFFFFFHPYGNERKIFYIQFLYLTL